MTDVELEAMLAKLPGPITECMLYDRAVHDGYTTNNGHTVMAQYGEQRVELGAYASREDTFEVLKQLWRVRTAARRVEGSL